ncbi:MAG: lactate utilization protein [Bacteroidia bacterium]|jgi:L-lactate dehydrogenase complex protein LldF|nr:lactate utilization protein [Bacteroidia bacterium]
MKEYKAEFLRKAAGVAFDQEHRRRINHNIRQYDKAVVKGKERLENIQQLRQKAYSTKFKALHLLDQYLVEFEANFQRKGGKVIWACTAEDALKEIIGLLEKERIEMVVKSKSMTTEEIHLNEFLEKKKIAVHETDLGEFIVQIAGEKPYHIVTPAMHKSKEDVGALYHEKFGLDANSTPEEITAFTRTHLREKFKMAGAGITGANFIVADTGSVAITENEGNALLSMTSPRLHIVIAGLEKVIPSVDDLDLFWPLLATYGTGQNMTVYNSLVSAPAAEGQGPQQMVVILLDNGRTELLSKSRMRMALGCIRCGACLNTCPVYKNIGGYTYNITYTGPIGAVISPHTGNFERNIHLSFASSLCGACTQVCPVNIPLHHMLLLNRQEAVSKKIVPKNERFQLKNASSILLNRNRLDMVGGGFKNKVLRYFVEKQWGDRRVLPQFAPKSFSRMWQEQNQQEVK